MITFNARLWTIQVAQLLLNSTPPNFKAHYAMQQQGNIDKR